MSTLKPCFYVTGWLLAFVGILMFIPGFLDLYDSYINTDIIAYGDWLGFITTGIISFFIGSAMVILHNEKYTNLTIKQGFIMIPFCWISLIIVGMIPFIIGSAHLSFPDALFETVSGVTTTGATILTNLEEMPRGILLWRAILNWIGGIGIIIVGISLLPVLRIGGMQIFSLESSDMSDKSMPSALIIAKSIFILYSFLSISCFSLFLVFGMTPFDALSHAMATVSTGGFSTSDKSMANFIVYGNNYLDLVAIFFMIICAMPFTVIIKWLSGSKLEIFKNQQTRFYLLYILFISLTIYFLYNGLGTDKNIILEYRKILFNTVSLISGTGFSTVDYNLWGLGACSILFCTMLVGGCSGSASCGLKIFRLQVIIASIHNFAKKLVHPHAIFNLKYNKQTLFENLISSVLIYFVVYFITFSIICVALNLVGHDFHTSLVATAATIANVGPGFGNFIGPLNTYENMNSIAKIILCFSMLLGRLEIYTLIIVITPNFWRK